MSAARPPEGAQAPVGGSDPNAVGERGGTVHAARPPEGAKAPVGGSDPNAVGERGGTVHAARPPEGAKAPLEGSAQALRDAFDQSFAQAPREAPPRQEGLLAIRIEGAPYAVRVAEIDGLHVDRRITALPSPMAELLGVVGFRGQMAPVYDLAALLGHARASAPRWLLQVRGGAHEPVALAFHSFEKHFSAQVHEAGPAAHDPAVHDGLSRAHALDEDGQGHELARPIISLRPLLQDIERRVALFLSRERGQA